MDVIVIIIIIIIIYVIIIIMIIMMMIIIIMIMMIILLLSSSSSSSSSSSLPSSLPSFTNVRYGFTSVAKWGIWCLRPLRLIIQPPGGHKRVKVLHIMLDTEIYLSCIDFGIEGVSINATIIQKRRDILRVCDHVSYPWLVIDKHVLTPFEIQYHNVSQVNILSAQFS